LQTETNVIPNENSKENFSQSPSADRISAVNTVIDPLLYTVALEGYSNVLVLLHMRPSNFAEFGIIIIINTIIITSSISYPIIGPDKSLELQEAEVPKIYVQSSHEGGKVASPKHRPPLPQDDDDNVHISPLMPFLWLTFKRTVMLNCVRRNALELEILLLF
jgi:hypothetical protein